MELRAETNERLDKFLTGKLNQFSRSQIQRMIKNGAIKINGRVVLKPATELRPGDRLDISEGKIPQLGKAAAFTVEPENIPINIVYEDKDIVVINKPAGLLTHPTPSEPVHTLANALVARYPEMAKVGESPFRPGIVHRLDKDTSGLIIAAKHQEAFEFIKGQFLKRVVMKKYLALVEGVPSNEEGVIEYSIRPSKKFRLKKVAVKQPFDKLRTRKSTRVAKTLYKIKEVLRPASSKLQRGEQAQDKSYALLEVTPLTGRTHQIRVHLSAIGHPIVGDRLYGSKSKLLERQFLHAYYLKFTAPNGASLALKIDLPEDLKETLAKLKS